MIQYTLLILCVVMIAVGQVLFKIAATSQESLVFLDKLFNPAFIIGLCIYMLATLLWIWLLQSIPLSTAYPFMALAFVFVPILAHFFVGEPFQIHYIIGGVVIFAGVYIIAR